MVQATIERKNTWYKASVQTRDLHAYRRIAFKQCMSKAIVQLSCNRKTSIPYKLTVWRHALLLKPFVSCAERALFGTPCSCPIWPPIEVVQLTGKIGRLVFKDRYIGHELRLVAICTDFWTTRGCDNWVVWLHLMCIGSHFASVHTVHRFRQRHLAAHRCRALSFFSRARSSVHFVDQELTGAKNLLSLFLT